MSASLVYHKDETAATFYRQLDLGKIVSVTLIFRQSVTAYLWPNNISVQEILS